MLSGGHIYFHEVTSALTRSHLLSRGRICSPGDYTEVFFRLPVHLCPSHHSRPDLSTVGRKRIWNEATNSPSGRILRATVLNQESERRAEITQLHYPDEESAAPYEKADPIFGSTAKNGSPDCLRRIESLMRRWEWCFDGDNFRCAIVLRHEHSNGTVFGVECQVRVDVVCLDHIVHEGQSRSWQLIGRSWSLHATRELVAARAVQLTSPCQVSDGCRHSFCYCLTCVLTAR